MGRLIAQIITGEVPGEQTINNILQADLQHTMLLIIALLVIALVLVIYLNGRAVNQMSVTQGGMVHTNDRFIAGSERSTNIMQAQVDETRRLREDYERTQMLNRQSLDAATAAITAHDDKVEGRVRAIITHATEQTEDIKHAVTDLLGEATATIKEATEAALERASQPALESLAELRKMAEALHTTQNNQMETLKRQQNDQMDLLKEQSEAQMHILKTQINRTEERLIQAIRTPDDTHTHTPLVSPVNPADSDASAPDAHNGTGEH